MRISGGYCCFRCLYPCNIKCSCRVLKKIRIEFHQGALAIIIFWRFFVGIPLKLKKVSLTLPCPSLPCLETDGRKQFQCLIVVLFLEFNIDAKTSFLRRQQIARQNSFKIQYEVAKLGRYFWNSMDAKHIICYIALLTKAIT